MLYQRNLTTGVLTALTKTQATALLTPVTVPTVYTVNPGTQEIVQDYGYVGENYLGEARGTALRVFAEAGQTITQAQLDAAYPVATITAIAPATGTSAGGTAVTITGTNFGGATSAAIGGVNITAFVVVNETTITGVSGAHAAGTVAVTVADDSGTATLAASYVYV